MKNSNYCVIMAGGIGDDLANVYYEKFPEAVSRYFQERKDHDSANF